MAFGKCSLMQYDLSVLIYHVSARPFFGRLKSPGFSSLCRTPKRGPLCEKLVIIESLNFGSAIRFDFADKYQTTVHYGLLKVRICQKRRSTLSVYC